MKFVLEVDEQTPWAVSGILVGLRQIGYELDSARGAIYVDDELACEFDQSHSGWKMMPPRRPNEGVARE